jgi:acyl carrier protein
MNPERMRRVREIVADVTLQPLQNVGEDAEAGRLDGWDSLAQINIIVAVEAAFGATFGADEVYELNSVGKILAALDALGDQ